MSAVVTIGTLVLVQSVHSLFAHPIGSEWLLLAGLTILTGSFSVKVPSINAYISVSEAFVFASVLLFGAEAGTVTVLLECLVILLWMKPQGRPLYRMFFNMAAPSVAIWTAGRGFYLLSAIHPYSEVFTPLPRLFLPLLAFTAAYFLLNSWLVAIAVGLETRRSAANIWWKNFAWLSVNYFSGASVAALIVTYTQRLDFSTLAVIVPLLVVSYLTFRTAMGRAEDSYNHLSELNRLYLSTIETLAMAIDAKDQITHGHIRRVQTYAVGLARRIGVSDDKLLKAIEAAALLHDMGKLAVPEHILNKPGKLTAAEFEKMKLHAGVGADILSAIDFPYPVVPIVRHHHENWDGTGYPSGLRGTNIPIGARILSVVDCFDALTSDRPYRPKLADDAALGILVDRRGSMYDPLIVDTFLRVYKDLATDQILSSSHEGALAEITTSTRGAREVRMDEQPGDGQDDSTSDLIVGSRGDRAADAWNLLRSSLEAAIPFDAAVIFRYDGLADCLTVCCASEQLAINNLTVGLGDRLSGWVAANRRAVVNSDPALDLGAIAGSFTPPLTNTLSVPVLAGEDLWGVVSLYARDVFSDEQRQMLERFAVRLSESMGQPALLVESLPIMAGGLLSARSATVTPVSSLLCLELLNWQDISSTSGDTERQAILLDVAAVVRAVLGANDMLVHYRNAEFVALLARAEVKDIRALARKVRSALAELNDRRPSHLRLDFAVDTMIAPIEPQTILELLSSDIGFSTKSTPAPRIH